METGVVDFETVSAVLDDLDAVWDKLASLPVEALAAPQVLAVLDRLEVQRRRQPATEHALITGLQSQCSPKDLGAKSWRAVLGARLGISGADAGRRLGDAAVVGPRRMFTGDPVPPVLPTIAAAQARGEIGAEHVAIARDFCDHLPDSVDIGTRVAAEAQLGELAGGLTPEGFRKLAHQLMGYLDQDGTLDDDRAHARKRGIVVGPQGLDGMSRLTGWVDPVLRAALDAVLIKLAAPGASRPDSGGPADPDPSHSGTPSADQITADDPDTADDRSAAQRTHDALHALCAAMLASGTLGSHHGLPVTIIATASLAEITAAAGTAHTATGTRIPIPTLLTQAGTLHPYLLLLDHPRQMRLYYGRTRRAASPGQFLALCATERGCTKPVCTTAAAYCQGHHRDPDWQHGGPTNIDNLTLACGPDNRLVNTTPTGWRTRQRHSDNATADNRTEWIPPPHLDRGQTRVNNHHHPERLLRPDDEPDDEAADEAESG